MRRKVGWIAGALMVFAFAPGGMVWAQYTSPHYMVNETFFGNGGELQDVSPSYQAKVASGELGADHESRPIQFIQGNSNYSGSSYVSTLSSTFSSNVTSGDLIVVATGWDNSVSSGTMSDSQGNTYSTAVGPTINASQHYTEQIYYAVAKSTGGDAVTLTLSTQTVAYVSVLAHEYSGANALDVTSANQGSSGSTINSGSAVTHYANELIFGQAEDYGGSATPTGGFSQRENTTSETTADKVVNTTGSYSATFTNSNSANWIAEMATFYNAGSGYQAYSGFNTTDRPVLEVAVTGGSFDMGTLTTSQARAISTSFTVRSYLASGYTIEVGGTPLKNNGSNYTLANLTSPTASNPGTEQFGINLAANNLPSIGAFGAAPAQVPDTTFGFGVANSNYSTTNLFKYIENDPIAHSDSSSGITEYTMSVIANISTTTPGGSYGTSLFVNAIPTF